MSALVENKMSVTQHIVDSLTKQGGKISYMPDSAIMDAIRTIEEKGIPNQKHEDYKYCNTEAILRKEFKTIRNSFDKVDKIDSYKLEGCVNVVVLNGEYNKALSENTTDAEISSLTDANKDILAKHLTKYADVLSDSFIALNTAFCTGGLFIHVKRSLSKPIHILNIVSANDNSIIDPRQLIVAENSTQCVIAESFVSGNNSGNVFHNHLTEIYIGENSIVKSYRVQNEDNRSYQINTTQAHVKRHGNYITNTFTFGGALVRNNLNVVLADDACETHLNGLFITNGTSLTDNHTVVDHQKPNCQSNELYKGIAKDRSTGVFNGKIFVRKDAQKTNAYQSSKNILLSDDATINTKPQLEIYADDVKCSHGTSTGKVDENALFYLKARGIGEDKARKLLLQAFAQELIDKIEIESLKDKITHLFENAL